MLGSTIVNLGCVERRSDNAPSVGQSAPSFCASFLESAAIRIALPQMTSPQVVSRDVVRSTTVDLGCQPSVAAPMAPSVAPIIAQRSATQRS
jgi:hypothetical protein